MSKELVKVTLNLNQTDWEFLRSYAPRGRASDIVRRLIERFVSDTRNRANLEERTDGRLNLDDPEQEPELDFG